MSTIEATPYGPMVTISPYEVAEKRYLDDLSRAATPMELTAWGRPLSPAAVSEVG